jgi:hypothetical protein
MINDGAKSKSTKYLKMKRVCVRWKKMGASEPHLPTDVTVIAQNVGTPFIWAREN